MSNPLKKVGKVFKKVAKTIKPIMKPLAIAAAIYFTGAALGAWGAGATGATVGATAGGAASGAGSGLGTLGAVEGAGSAASGLSLGATSGGATTQALGMGASEAAAGLSAGAQTAATVAPQAASTAGTLKGAGKAILGFIEKNPATTMIAGQALSSAFTPTAAEEQLKLEQARRRRSTFYGTGLGGQGPGINTGALSSVMSGFNQNQYAPAPQIAGTQYDQPMQQGAMVQQPQFGAPGGALSQYAGMM